MIDWVMRWEGVSFRHAVELLRDGIAPSTGPVAARSSGSRPARSTVAKLPSPLERAADDRELLGRVAGFYSQTLRESAEALAYLERRGLQHPELLERFRLGYANRTLGYRLPAKNRQAGAQLRGRLQRLGVLRDSGHEHLSGSLVSYTCTNDATSTRLRSCSCGNASSVARRRRRDMPRQQLQTPAASTPSRMARVAVADDVWADFRALAEPKSIATVLGELVQREVDRDHARRLKAGTLDDAELVDALHRAQELHENLTQIVARLERRLDRQPIDPDG